MIWSLPCSFGTTEATAGAEILVLTFKKKSKCDIIKRPDICSPSKESEKLVAKNVGTLLWKSVTCQIYCMRRIITGTERWRQYLSIITIFMCLYDDTRESLYCGILRRDNAIPQKCRVDQHLGTVTFFIKFLWTSVFKIVGLRVLK